MSEDPILIAGPTASGKSALALELALTLGGCIINADSQQVYREWQVLSARPTAEEEAVVPHRLYGHVSASETYSAGHWLRDVTAFFEAGRRRSQVSIIVGGTGLYFKALTSGLAPIPSVDPEIRRAGEDRLERMGLTGVAAELLKTDPETARRIDLENPRRVLRAWEVLAATGTGLAAWQSLTTAPVVPIDGCRAIALTPPRPWLVERCAQRMDRMIEAGALNEVRTVIDMGLTADAPGLKAVGAAPLMAHLDGALALGEAVERAKIETRQYAKRQMTWIRNQMGSWQKLDPSDPSAVRSLIKELTERRSLP